jgi:hypothetical protein
MLAFYISTRGADWNLGGASPDDPTLSISPSLSLGVLSEHMCRGVDTFFKTLAKLAKSENNWLKI